MSTDKVHALVVAPHGNPGLISTRRVLRNTCGQLSLFAFGSSKD